MTGINDLHEEINNIIGDYIISLKDAITNDASRHPYIVACNHINSTATLYDLLMERYCTNLIEED